MDAQVDVEESRKLVTDYSGPFEDNPKYSRNILEYISQRLELDKLQGTPQEQLLALIAMMDYKSDTFALESLFAQVSGTSMDLVRRNNEYFRNPWELFIEYKPRRQCISPAECESVLRSVLLSKLNDIIERIPTADSGSDNNAINDVEKAELISNIEYAKDITKTNRKLRQKLRHYAKIATLSGVFSGGVAVLLAGITGGLVVGSLSGIGLVPAAICAIATAVAVATSVASFATALGLLGIGKCSQRFYDSKITARLKKPTDVPTTSPILLAKYALFSAATIKTPRVPNYIRGDVSYTEREYLRDQQRERDRPSEPIYASP